MCTKDQKYGSKTNKNKIQAIRDKSKGKGLEECTFQPRLNKKAHSMNTIRKDYFKY